MTGRIFISYRREDTAGFALALFGRLEQSFPPERLFMDVEGGIGAGQDFVRVIEEQVGTCDAMLVLIGPNWLTVADERGQRRLENSQDFVRIEVESALRFGKRVIPVLVQKTEMPRADALPEPLKALARRNAVGLTEERFKADAQGLTKALENALAEVEEARRQAETEAAAAEKRREAEEAAKSEETARAEKERARLEAITGLSPEQIAKAEELANWDFIKASESIEDFRDHLARFPQGVTDRMARARLETLVWVGLTPRVNTHALNGFLAEFPKGAYASEATAKLAELESRAEATRKAAERKRCEMDAWASASAAATVAALEDFRNAWPHSKYADAARSRIEEIRGGSIWRGLADAVRRFSNWIDAVWGYDVFIAHRPADAAEYAVELYEALEAQRIACFIDRAVYGSGDPLAVATRRHVRKSTLFVLLGSPEILSPHKPEDRVEEEINEYLASHASDPRIIPVDFGDTIANSVGAPNSIPQLVQNFVRISEALSALVDGPSESVLNAIRSGLDGRRRDRTRIRFFEVTASALAILLVAALSVAAIALIQLIRSHQNLSLAFPEGPPVAVVSHLDAVSSVAFSLDRGSAL